MSRTRFDFTFLEATSFFLSWQVAIATAERAFEDGVAQRVPDIQAKIKEAMWTPEYPRYRPAPAESAAPRL
jgi:hypothetical protein